MLAEFYFSSRCRFVTSVPDALCSPKPTVSCESDGGVKVLKLLLVSAEPACSTVLSVPPLQVLIGNLVVWFGLSWVLQLPLADAQSSLTQHTVGY